MQRLFITFLVFIILVLPGCGTNVFDGIENKSTEEAVRVQILNLLDDGNWDAVLSHPDATSLDISAAAVGKAGFNNQTLLRAIALIADSVDPSDLTPISGGSLINPAALPDLDFARDMLQADLDVIQGDANLHFQMIVLSIVDAITVFGEGLQNIGADPRDGISPLEALSLGGAVQADPLSVALPRLGLDTTNMVTNLPGADLGAGSEIASAIGDVANGIDPDGDGTVTPIEAAGYLINVLGQ